MRLRAVLFALGLSSTVLTACPDPDELGHKPKQQIDKAQRAVDKAEQSMQDRVNKAAKAGGPATTQE